MTELKNFKSKLKKFNEEVDSSLVAGFIITMGSIVIDASLKNKIQKAMRNG